MQKLEIKNQRQNRSHPKQSTNKKALKVVKHLMGKFPTFAEKILKIRTDTGIIPFALNREQFYLHERIEEQKQLTGMVRIMILKGRQQGCSTYVSGRFYHKSIHRPGTQTFILTHEGKATDTLFQMVKRFHENSNPSMRPKVGKSNAKELVFPGLDSAYKVGTADNESVGRSMNNQLLHASEVAFWRVGEKLAAGVFQSVHMVPGTEIIMESTANGMGNFFHRQWKLAESGKSPYLPIFIPWYWHIEYQLAVPKDFKLSESDIDYKDAYDLTMEQMAWRRVKEQELGEILFKQEYPATPDEAFQVTGKNKLIDTLLITKARKQKPYRSHGAIIVGLDPKRDGDDRVGVVYRQALNVFDLRYYNYNDVTEVVALAKRILLGKDNGVIPDALFMDYGGSGWEAGCILRQDLPALAHKIRVVNFGAKANQSHLYTNRRNEMWQEMEKWLSNKNEPPSIPDSDELHADLVSVGYTHESNNRKVMQSKKDIKKELGFSPDGGDALALTFAEPVIINHVMDNEEHYQLKLSGE